MTSIFRELLAKGGSICARYRAATFPPGAGIKFDCTSDRDSQAKKAGHKGRLLIRVVCYHQDFYPGCSFGSATSYSSG
jgi:hypothetical protein